jgi:hypothetical protein
MERETGIEPATNSLEGCDSTTELLPRFPRPEISSAFASCLRRDASARQPSPRCAACRAEARLRYRVSWLAEPKPRVHDSFGAAKAGGEGRTRTFEAARATDLQSAAFDRFATSPAVCVMETRASGRSYVSRWSWRRDLNPRPADYKSAALPTELRQPDQNANFSTSRATMARQCAAWRDLTSYGGASTFPATFYCYTSRPLRPSRFPSAPRIRCCEKIDYRRCSGTLRFLKPRDTGS